MSEEKYLKWEKHIWGGEWHIRTLGCWSPEEYKRNVCIQLKDILKRKGKESYKKALISILSQLRSEHYDWKDIIEYFTYVYKETHRQRVRQDDGEQNA